MDQALPKMTSRWLGEQQGWCETLEQEMAAFLNQQQGPSTLCTDSMVHLDEWTCCRQTVVNNRSLVEETQRESESDW